MTRDVLMLCLLLSAAACSNGPSKVPDNTNIRDHDRDRGAETTSAQTMTTPQLVERIRKKHADRLAGLYVDEAGRRIVVRLTGLGSVPSEFHKVGSSQTEVVFLPNASHTFEQLNRMLSDGSKVISAKLPTAHARYVDERTGEMVIAVVERPKSENVLRDLAAELGGPVRIVVQAPLESGPARAKPL